MYASSRTLYGLACDGKAPAIFRRCTKNGIPIWCVTLTAVFGLLAYLNVSVSGSVVFNWFVNLSAITGLITWWSILLTYIRFYNGCKAQGIDRKQFPYVAPLQPYAAYFGFVFISVIIFFSGFAVFLQDSWNYQTFITDYITIPIFIAFCTFLPSSRDADRRRRVLEAVQEDARGADPPDGFRDRTARAGRDLGAGGGQVCRVDHLVRQGLGRGYVESIGIVTSFYLFPAAPLCARDARSERFRRKQSRLRFDQMSWYGVSSLFVGGNVTCLGVDGSSELLWTGRASGHVASYGCTPRGLDGRYTGWRSSLSPLSTLRLDAGGVLSLGGNSVHYASRGGVCAFSLALAQPLTTSVDTPGRSTELALAGPASPLLLLNLNTKSITRQYVPPKPIAKLARGALLVAATTEGDVQLLDVRTKELVVSQTVKAHSGGVKELETQGDFVVTVGYTLRQSLALPDPFLKLHDVRFLRPLSPIPFPSPPALVKFHPKLSSTVLVLSAEGRGQMLDLKNLVNGHTGSLFQVETSGFLTTMAMAPTGEGLVVADTGGYVHLWSVGEGAKFCRYELDLEGPAERVRPELVNWLPDTPLNSIGMPHYEEPLLSLLPPSVEQLKRTPLAPVISPTILAGVKTVDFIGYAPYGTEERSKGRRNQVRSDKLGEDGVGGSKGVAGPLFRSEREREEARRRGRGVELDLGAELGKSVDEGSSRETLPGYYRKVEIKYSRFGVEDFDFGCARPLSSHQR